MSAEDIDFANEAKERLTCAYEGADIEIGFNSKFLFDMVNSITTQQIKFELSAPNRAVIILPVMSMVGALIVLGAIRTVGKDMARVTAP